MPWPPEPEKRISTRAGAPGADVSQSGHLLGRVADLPERRRRTPRARCGAARRRGSGRGSASRPRRTCRPARHAPSATCRNSAGSAREVEAPVVDGADGHRLDHGEALVDDAAGDDVDQLLIGPGGAAGDVGRPRGMGQLAEVEGGLDVAVHARRRLVAEVRRGAHLAAGHAVDRVVEDERREVDVAPRGVDEVVAADGRAVAVAHGDDDVQRRIGGLDPGGDRQGAAVGGVHRRVVQVGADAAAAADAGDDHDLLGVELEAEDGVDERPRDGAVGAARAPQRLGGAQVRLISAVVCGLMRGSLGSPVGAASSRCSSTRALMRPPSAGSRTPA